MKTAPQPSPKRLIPPQASAWDRLCTRLLQATWTVIDRLAGADSKAVLNTGEPTALSEGVSRDLYRTARQIKAEAISPDGQSVDYAALSQSEAYARLRRFTLALPVCDLVDLGDEKAQLAFWINLYNTVVLDGVIRFQISDRVGLRLFRAAAYDVCGMRFCADDIEHGVLRGNRSHPLFRLRSFGPADPRRRASLSLDPRIHFALVCGAKSCPPIGFYEAARVDEHLDQAAHTFINAGWVKFDSTSRVLAISRVFDWYKADFGGSQGVRQTLLRYLEDGAARQAVQTGGYRLRYLDYDWSVNAIA